MKIKIPKDTTSKEYVNAVLKLEAQIIKKQQKELEKKLRRKTK